MIAGAGLRIAAVAGTLLMLFMFLAEWPTATSLVDGKAISGRPTRSSTRTGAKHCC
jgi:thiosulfate dehydrogenase [quinone] large subunit